MVHLGDSRAPQLETSIPPKKAAEELHESHPATLQTLQSLKRDWDISALLRSQAGI